ncbi:MAG: glycosyl hydrolase family 28-related protein [Pirellulaceae bacterium]
MALAIATTSTPTANAEPRAEYNVRDFGAVGDGVTDDSTAFQTAIDEAYLAGGGLVVVPGSIEGYALAKPLLIRPNVTLKGFHAGPADAHILALCDANLDAKTPSPVSPVPGGLLIKQDKYPAITLAHNSGITGLTFSYPEQVPYSGEKIRVYPPLMQIKGVGHDVRVPGVPRTHGIENDGPISGRSVAIRDIGAINAYHILDMSGDNPIFRQVAQITVSGLWGYPLSVGLSIQNSLDTISLHNIQFRPSFFGGACEQITKSSIGFAIGKSDGLVMSDVLVFGLAVGVLHRCTEGSMGAFSVRVSNANIEAMIPIWFDSCAVDDQIQYVNSFLFHTTFAAKPQPGDVYTRVGHPLFSDLTIRPADFCVARISNNCKTPTCQSYARFVGCGFHATNAGPVCRIEGTQLVRMMLASSNMVYFKDSVLEVAPGAKVAGVITGNDIKVVGADLTHLLDMEHAGAETRVIFSNNMLQGVRQPLIDEISGQPGVTAQGNASL